MSKEPLQFRRSTFSVKPSLSSSFYSNRRARRSRRKQRSGRPRLAARRSAGASPFSQVLTPTGSGHPTGFTYGWVSNDGRNLYVTIDFTPDNTYDDDKDYAKVIARGNGQVRISRSRSRERWGRAHFVKTDKVDYEHKVNDNVIRWPSSLAARPAATSIFFAATGQTRVNEDSTFIWPTSRACAATF